VFILFEKHSSGRCKKFSRKAHENRKDEKRKKQRIEKNIEIEK